MTIRMEPAGDGRQACIATPRGVFQGQDYLVSIRSAGAQVDAPVATTERGS